MGNYVFSLTLLRLGDFLDILEILDFLEILDSLDILGHLAGSHS